jgi:DNA (cytosine-5)-methyltransferase 1
MASGFTFIDLFAGVGGMRLAFESAGGKCVFSSEWDKYAQKTYQANFGELPEGDIRDVNEGDIDEFNVLVAGFPCQPFSNIGKREGFGHPTQGTLFYEIVRILQHHEPEMFLLENVVGLVTHDQGQTFATILETLDQLGYDVAHQVLDAAGFEVPQHRERIYIVGMHREKLVNREFIFPTPSSDMVGIGKFIESNVAGYEISEHLQNVYIYKREDGRPQIVTPQTDEPVKTLVSTYHKIQRLTGTFVADGPTGLRLLTVDECKAVMGFPKTHHFPVSRTQMYRQMGNSVAVPVVTKIAEQMAVNLKSRSNAK